MNRSKTMQFVLLVLFVVLNSKRTSCQLSSSYLQSNNATTNDDPVQLANVSVGGYLNQSDLETLEQKLGPRKKDLTFQIIMSIAYIVIFICGLIGNLCVCCVIIFNDCMHTTTNYYLFSLAISDLLSLLIGKLCVLR
jgi:hypothetical protein